MNKLILSRWKTPDGTILISSYTHDYVSHHDKNGEYYFVDGGRDYIRMSVNKQPMVDMCLYYDSPYEELRKYVKRGTFDKHGRRIWIPICNMSDRHLLNCIAYTRLGLDAIMYMRELVYRHENSISVKERAYCSTKKNTNAYDKWAKPAKILQNGLFDGDWRDGYNILVSAVDSAENEEILGTYFISIMRRCIENWDSIPDSNL